MIEYSLYSSTQMIIRTAVLLPREQICCSSRRTIIVAAQSFPKFQHFSVDKNTKQKRHHQSYATDNRDRQAQRRYSSVSSFLRSRTMPPCTNAHTHLILSQRLGNLRHGATRRPRTTTTPPARRRFGYRGRAILILIQGSIGRPTM
jgi:hypothetical protein